MEKTVEVEMFCASTDSAPSLALIKVQKLNTAGDRKFNAACPFI
jgi:hypothetical protein